MKPRLVAASLLITTLIAGQAAAREEIPNGLIAVSVGDDVILADPVSGGTIVIRCGPVAWLYPAPGGVLFAPDLVNGFTTVIDLQTLQVLERLEGVSMPIFGGSPDRYVVAASDVVVVSYPERAFLSTIAAGLRSPWQTIVTQDDGILFVLERQPEGGDSALVAVDLLNRQVAYRKKLDGGVVRMALSRSLGLLAFAEQDRDRLTLADPASLSTRLSIRLGGSPGDLTFFGEQGLAVTAVRPGDRGELRVLQLKAGRKGLRIKTDYTMQLSGSPQRLAAGPGQQRLAVALSDGRVEIINLDKMQVTRTLVLPSAVRDLIWCDPQADGPLLPKWSDRRAEASELELGFPPEAEIAGGELELGFPPEAEIAGGATH